MVSTKPKITWKTIILSVIGILAFLVYLYLFNVDIPTIIETAQHIDLSIYTLSTLFVFVETFFYTLSWQSLLNLLSVKLPIVKAYLYVWYGTFMDVVVPSASISGDVSKLYLVTREQSGTGGKVVATLVTQRLISIGTVITSLIIGIGILSAERQTSGLPFKLALFFAIATTLFLVLFVLLCFKEMWMLQIIDAVMGFVNYISRGRWNLIKIKKDAIRAARMFHDSMKEFGRAPKTLFTSTLFAVLSWLSSLSIAYLVLLALNFHVRLGVILVTCSIVTVVPVRGLPEITMATIYTLLGVPPKISATATILTRILTFWLKFFVGFAAQQWLEIKTIATSVNTTEAGKAQKRALTSLKASTNFLCKDQSANCLLRHHCRKKTPKTNLYSKLIRSARESYDLVKKRIC